MNKIILENNLLLETMKYEKIEGTLETYFETGLECIGLVISDDKVIGTPNSDYNPSLPESGVNFKTFKSIEAIHFVKSGDILEIDGVKYLMDKNIKLAKEDGFRLSFYCSGFSRGEFLSLFRPCSLKATLWSLKK